MFGMCGYGPSTPSSPSEPSVGEDNFHENLMNSIPTTEQLQAGWRKDGNVQSKARTLISYCLEELSLSAFPELTTTVKLSICHFARAACQIAFECLSARIQHVYYVQNENGVDRHFIFSALPDPFLEAEKQRASEGSHT